AQWTHGHAPCWGDALTPWRHHVRARPPRAPVGSEEHWPPWWCAAGGAGTRAPWPAGGPRGTSGPRGHARGSLGPGACRVSTRAPPQRRPAVGAVPWRGGPLHPREPAPPAAGAAPLA